MKTHLIIKLKKIGFAIASLLFILACQNEDKDLQDPKFSKTGEIFTDTPIGMGTNFYFPYGPGPDNPIGSKLNAWTVDQNVSYKGNASMRFDVPSENDTEGNYWLLGCVCPRQRSLGRARRRVERRTHRRARRRMRPQMQMQMRRGTRPPGTRRA